MDLWIVCVLIRGIRKEGEDSLRGVCVCARVCLLQWRSRAESDNKGEKENMIEWDILSAADVSWSPDWVCFVCVCVVCVCISIRVYQSLSHPGPIL